MMVSRGGSMANTQTAQNGTAEFPFKCGGLVCEAQRLAEIRIEFGGIFSPYFCACQSESILKLGRPVRISALIKCRFSGTPRHTWGQARRLDVKAKIPKVSAVLPTCTVSRAGAVADARN